MCECVLYLEIQRNREHREVLTEKVNMAQNPTFSEYCNYLYSLIVLILLPSQSLSFSLSACPIQNRR
jgi:hypothetical protein